MLMNMSFEDVMKNEKKKSLGSVAYEISKHSFEHLGSLNNCDKILCFS